MGDATLETLREQLSETYAEILLAIEQVNRDGGRWLLEMLDEILVKRVAAMVRQNMAQPPAEAEWMCFEIGGEKVVDPETGQVIKIAVNDAWNWDIVLKMLPLCKPNGIGKLVYENP